MQAKKKNRMKDYEEKNCLKKENKCFRKEK